MKDEHGVSREGESALDCVDPHRTMVRPSIFHLMIFTAFSGLLFAIYRLLYGEGAVFEGTINAGGLRVGLAILCSATLTGSVVLLAERKRRGRPLARQPGHWLLLTAAASTCLILAALVLVGFYDPQVITKTKPWFFWLLAVVESSRPLLHVIAARKSTELIWKSVFWCLALLTIFHCLFYALYALFESGYAVWMYSYGLWLLFQTVPRWGLMIVAFALLLISIYERLNGMRRDWLHWSGVVTHVLGNVVTILIFFMR